MSRLALALVHWPVLDRDGAVVTTAITNLDLHDLSRSARTYGVSDVFVVHPVAAQRKLAERIREHWVGGSGKERIPDRAAALELLRVVPTLDDARAALRAADAGRPHEMWTTAAAQRGGAITPWPEARARLDAATGSVLVLFGTGWGLPPDLCAAAEVRLEPIHGAPGSGYNHLSVRAACAITLDRLRG
jgi:hypothetical protein